MRNRKYTKKTGLSFFAKIKYLDGKVRSRRSPLKRKISNFLPKDSLGIKWVYIRVTYKRGIYNDGKYLANELKNMKCAWESFIEEDLIKDAINNY